MTFPLFSRLTLQHELAVETLQSLIGVYANALSIERDKSEPDKSLIRLWTNEQQNLRCQLDELDCSDALAIKSVLEKHSPKVKALNSVRL